MRCAGFVRVSLARWHALMRWCCPARAGVQWEGLAYVIDRISILGGSSVYIPEFVFSLISHNINVKEICLIGRPGQKLQLVSHFCQRLLAKSGFPARIISTSNPEEGFMGAKYILNHIRVGGLAARARDEKLPVKYGMIGDETLGAGGFANALRTLPIVLDYARRIEAVNPNATFINLTNPLGVIVEALLMTSKLKVIGVCDLPQTTVLKIAELLTVPVEQLNIDYIGLNHMGWIQDVKIDGRSVMPRLLERIDHGEEDGFDRQLVELYRMIPAKTVGLFFHKDDVLKKQLACPKYRAEALQEAERQILKLYENPTLNEIPSLTRERNAVWYESTIIPLIAALENPCEKEMVLCVRNEGSIRDLPEGCSVEVPVRVGKCEVKPRQMGNSPRFLKGLFTAAKECDRLTVEAVRHKSYEYALQALTLNPLVPSVDTARRYLDRILKDEQLAFH
jgi:6-phospho-beta-glucosidase